MVQGQEFHSIIEGIFGDVKGLYVNNQLQVNCPRCQERDGLPTPDGKYNLEINPQKRVFRCWKCENPFFSGTLGRLIKTYGGSTNYELYRSLAGVMGDYTPNEDDIEFEPLFLPKEYVSFKLMDNTNADHMEAYKYMVLDRKIDKELLYRYNVGFCLSGRYRKRIVVPSYDKYNELNFFVTRNYDKTNKKRPPYDNPKVSKNIIFNENLINWDSTVFLVEGVFDMFSVPPNVIPLLGKKISSELFIKLKELKPNIIVLLDPDAITDAIQLFYMLQTAYVGYEQRVKIIELPGDNDIDEHRKLYGKEHVVNLLYSARDITIDDYFKSKLTPDYNFEQRKKFWDKK